MPHTTCIVQIINQSPHPLPRYATAGAAGMDLRAYLPLPILLQPLDRVLVGTGISIALPLHFEAQVRPRSGLANEYGITVLNNPGTIDADYRGEIKILLINLSSTSFTVRNGQRIAQLVISSCTQAQWEEVATLPPTLRGTGGFGSTGQA